MAITKKRFLPPRNMAGIRPLARLAQNEKPLVALRWLRSETATTPQDEARKSRAGDGQREPRPGHGIRAPTERGSESLGGTLGWGVGGTPEGVYEGMPLTGTPQPSANHRRCNVRAPATHRRCSAGQRNTPVSDPAEAHVGAARPTHERLQQTEPIRGRLSSIGSGIVASRAEEYRRRAQRCLYQSSD